MPGWDSIPWAFLILARLTSFMILAPFFAIKGTPNLIKIGLGVFLTVLLFPSIKMPGNIPVDVAAYSVLVIKEVIIGLILGYVSMLTLNAIKIAGELIDIQMGFAMATVFDPQNYSEITLIGQFLFLLQMLLFFAVDGHHSLLMALSYSFTLIPVTGAVFKTAFVTAILKMFIEMFSLGIRIATPFIIAFLICDIGLGILARTVPQLNVFILSFPMKNGIGLVAIAAILPIMTALVNNIISQMENNLGIIMGLIH